MKKTAFVSFAWILTASGALASTMVIDKSASTVEWFASKVTGKHNGTIDVKSGAFELDEKGEIKSGNVEIDMASLKDTDISDEKNNAKLTRHLKSEDFFDVEKWPTSKFTLKTFKKAGKANKEGWQRAEITGDLTIRDMTNEITFPAMVKMTGDGADATAEITLDRTKWNVKYGSGKFFPGLGDHLIHDKFKMSFKVKAKKS